MRRQHGLLAVPVREGGPAGVEGLRVSDPSLYLVHMLISCKIIFKAEAGSGSPCVRLAYGVTFVSVWDCSGVAGDSATF